LVIWRDAARRQV